MKCGQTKKQKILTVSKRWEQEGEMEEVEEMEEELEEEEEMVR